MFVSPDADVEAALPLLKSLFALSDLEHLSWRQLSSKDGYIVSELPPNPTLGLPQKCYRTQFVVNADLDSFHHVLKDEASMRLCDPTLNELRTLEQRGCTTLVYASYASPSPWLVAPRDFCVWSAAVFTTQEQLRRVSSGFKLGCAFAPDGALATSACSQSRQGCGGASDTERRIYLQNSVTAPEVDATAAPTLEKGKPLVRGFIHCFGYMAFEDPACQGGLRVMNYCCVDPAGHIPKWVIAAAVSENTNKMRRLAALAESAGAAARAANCTLSSPSALSTEELQATQPLESQIAVADSPLALSLIAEEEVVSTPSPAKGYCDPTPSPAAPTMEGPLAKETVSSPSTKLDAVGSMASLSTDFPPPVQPLAAEQRGSSPPSGMKSSPARDRCPHTSMSPRQPATARSLDPLIQLLSSLARSHGWHTRREAGGLEYAELRTLPEPLRSNDPLIMAMRVSTSLHCRLDTFSAVLRSPALAPVIDPELVRVLNIGASSGGFHQTVRHKPTTSVHVAVPAAGQLRHYQFDAGDLFQCPWDMALECTEAELTQPESSRYGFHAPSVPAATYVWVSADNTNSCYRGVHPDSHCQHMQVRVFGVIAVAVSRSADRVRVSQYMLFKPTVALPSICVSRWYLSLQKRSAAAEFLSGVSRWMERRMDRLRSLCEAQQRRQNSSNMVALDKEPLLHFLYKVHCAEGDRALESPGTLRYGDVFAKYIPWTTEAASPPLVVLSLVFPCSLTQLRDFMLCSSPRDRYALENGVHSYDELPSPPGFTAVRVQYDAASASFPWVRLTLLEAFGEVQGVDVPRRALVLSCAGVDEDVGNAFEVMDRDGEGLDLTVDVDERFENGRVFCYGWVATAPHGDGARACADGPSVGLGHSCTGVTHISSEVCSMRSALNDEAKEIAQHHPEYIVLMKYLSVALPCSHQPDLDAAGLPCGFIAEQAAVLQRFRDAVCMWSSINVASSR
ncbi:hypothetical protein JKF63_00773 [Porcisia hertigi]|uniref:START domain-containing protein n=1 Tax=Porcisia hertigi TaxID=2761500 RepID=A0A836HC88_9TRYP|nr:hypothetical protein JKF63_00773 [Porcisia hertigi]